MISVCALRDETPASLSRLEPVDKFEDVLLAHAFSAKPRREGFRCDPAPSVAGVHEIGLELGLFVPLQVVVVAPGHHGEVLSDAGDAGWEVFGVGHESVVLRRYDIASKLDSELPWKVVSEVLPAPGGPWNSARHIYLQLSAAYQSTADQAEEHGYRVRRMDGNHLAMVTQPTTVTELRLPILGA
ncbi:hypothetical protein GA0074695_2407 [Micromonospora viridifaciens]|uniref:Uncharacterized protein n=1 Tax=Micromonospora viridifaciens TaxID=1881 RepID=A0A1C4WG07_MICVI|nr:hypothetical protein GA0074695_2407 [Micromonospora viridifaciens]